MRASSATSTIPTDDPERRYHQRRRRAEPVVLIEHRLEVGRKQLVAVDDEDFAALSSPVSREPDAPATSERLWLLSQIDLRLEPAERLLEELPGSRRAADDHPRHASSGQHANLILRERPPPDTDERFRQSLRSRTPRAALLSRRRG